MVDLSNVSGTLIIAIYAAFISTCAVLISAKTYLDKRREKKDEKKPDIEVTTSVESALGKENFVHVAVKNNGKVTVPIRNIGVHTFGGNKNRNHKLSYENQMEYHELRDKCIKINFEPIDLEHDKIYSVDIDMMTLGCCIDYNREPDDCYYSIFVTDDKGNYYECESDLIFTRLYRHLDPPYQF